MIAAAAALLFACDLSSGGDDDPAADTGSIAVEVRGAAPVADPTNLPAQIDCRLVQGGAVVASWSVLPADFTAAGSSFTFTKSGLEVGDYTLEVDLQWADDPGVPECTGTSAALSIAKDTTTPVVVDVTPVEFVDLAYPGQEGIYTPVTDTPTAAGDYRPHWFRIGPLPANTGDGLQVTVGVGAGLTGTAGLYLLQNGVQLAAPVENMDGSPPAYFYINMADPPAGYVWACVYGDPAGVSYKLRYEYDDGDI